MQDKPQNYGMDLHECYSPEHFSYFSFLDLSFLGEVHVQFFRGGVSFLKTNFLPTIKHQDLSDTFAPQNSYCGIEEKGI